MFYWNFAICIKYYKLRSCYLKGYITETYRGFNAIKPDKLPKEIKNRWFCEFE